MRYAAALFLTIALLTLPVRQAAANSTGGPLYSMLKEITIAANIYRHQDAAGSYLRSLAYVIGGMAGAKPLPMSDQQVGDAVKRALENRLQTREKIKITNTGYLFGGGEDATKLHMSISLEYWDADDFSPRLDHDVIMISVDLKRRLPEETGRANKIEKRHKSTLMSVPTVTEDIENNIRRTLENLFDSQIIPYINCGNGGSCKGF